MRSVSRVGGDVGGACGEVTAHRLDESGFGLIPVDALASDWGLAEFPRGKAVRAELTLTCSPAVLVFD